MRNLAETSADIAACEAWAKMDEHCVNDQERETLLVAGIKKVADVSHYKRHLMDKAQRIEAYSHTIQDELGEENVDIELLKGNIEAILCTLDALIDKLK